MSKLTIKNEAEPAGNADTGTTKLYVDSTSKLLSSKDDAGLVTEYGSGGGGGGTDWELASQGTIHATNYVDNDTVYTHPNHSGDVTSVADGAQTIASTAISGKTLVTAATGDHVLVGDASDSDNLKKVTVQTIVDLAAGGGIENPVDTNWKIRRNQLDQGDGNHFWGELPLYGAASTGASIAERVPAIGDENRVGIVRLTGGTTYASLMSSVGGISFREGGAQLRMGSAVKVLNVPDATDDYRAWWGYSIDVNSIGSYMSVIGIDYALSTTNYVCWTRRGGTQTTVVTSVAIDTSWHNMEVLINAANTSHTYYIDGVLVATITTNMPNAGSAAIAFIEQVAGASRAFDFDWTYLAHKPTSALGVIHTWIS